MRSEASYARTAWSTTQDAWRVVRRGEGVEDRGDRAVGQQVGRLDEPHVVAGHQVESRCPGRTGTEPGLVALDAQPAVGGSEVGKDLRRVVGRRVVDDEHLDVGRAVTEAVELVEQAGPRAE